MTVHLQPPSSVDSEGEDDDGNDDENDEPPTKSVEEDIALRNIASARLISTKRENITSLTDVMSQKH